MALSPGQTLYGQRVRRIPRPAMGLKNQMLGEEQIGDEARHPSRDASRRGEQRVLDSRFAMTFQTFY